MMKIIDLIDAVRPIVDAVKINDDDTIGLSAPDGRTIWWAQGGQGQESRVTLGHMRRIAQLVGEFEGRYKDNADHEIGWYSERAAQLYGTSWWATPTGTEVEVTCVGPGTDYRWPDKEYRGKVTHWARDGRLRGQPLVTKRKPLTAKQIDALIQQHVGACELTDGEYYSMVLFATAVDHAHGIEPCS